jgi:3-deoxy-7-phosphoheptulonate synthase
VFREDVVLESTPKEELEKIVDRFEKQGLDVTLITGKDYNVFGLVGDTTKIDERDVLANPWIDNVTRVSAPYKRANRLFHPADSVIDCGGVKIGGKEKIAVMAGPCSIESEEQALRIAQGVKAGGATLFRGGAYKPRTSPYSFQGLETEGILDMVKAREATGMPIVSELMSEERIPEFEEYVDVVQIGARNMQGCGQDAQARSAQARPLQHHRRVDHERRVHHGRRQRAGHPL